MLQIHRNSRPAATCADVANPRNKSSLACRSIPPNKSARRGLAVKVASLDGTICDVDSNSAGPIRRMLRAISGPLGRSEYLAARVGFSSGWGVAEASFHSRVARFVTQSSAVTTDYRRLSRKIRLLSLRPYGYHHVPQRLRAPGDGSVPERYRDCLSTYRQLTHA